MTTEDAARILGVSPETPFNEAKDAYRRLARFYHPDRQASSDLKDLAESKLKEVNLAFEFFKTRETQDLPQWSSEGSSANRAADFDRRNNQTADEDVPIFDLDAFWHEVEAVRVPQFPYTRSTVEFHVFLPTPIPQSAVPGPQLPIQRTVAQKTVGWIAVAASGLMVLPYTRLFGFNIAAAFSVWWCIYEWLALKVFDADNQPRLRARNELQTEHSRRDQVRQSVISELESAEACRRDSIGQVTRGFAKCLAQLKEWTNLYAELENEIDAEIKQIVSDDYDLQLDQFLASHHLRDFKLPGIGSSRLAQLESLGFVTAADIKMADLYEIPGFGPALIETLFSFRDFAVSRFQHSRNPDAPILTNKLHSLIEEKIDCGSRLEKGLQSLRKISHQEPKELQSLDSRIQELVKRLAQAKADAVVCQNALTISSTFDFGWLALICFENGTTKQKACLLIAVLGLVFACYLARPQYEQHSTLVAANTPELQSSRVPVTNVLNRKQSPAATLPINETQKSTQPDEPNRRDEQRPKPFQKMESPKQAESPRKAFEKEFDEDVAAKLAARKKADDESKQKIKEAATYRMHGLEKLEAGDYPQAIEALSKSIELSPTAESYSDRAFAHFKTGNLDKAKIDSETAESLLEKNWPNEVSKTTEASIESLTRAIRRNPTADAYAKRATAHFKAGNFDQAGLDRETAERLSKEAAKKNPKSK